MRKFSDTMWIIILLALTCIIGYLLYTQKIILFLSPRMMIVVVFGFCVLLGLFVYNLGKHLSKKQNHGSAFRISYLMFLVPIFLFITATPDENTIENLPNKDLTLSYGASNSQEDGENAESDLEVPDTFSNSPVDFIPCVLTNGLPSIQPDDQFKECLHYDLDEMWGKEFTIHGFVMKDDRYEEGVIIVARNIVTCCIADSYPAGYAVRTDDADKLRINQWIIVTGTIDGIEMESYGQAAEYPILTDGTIIKREKMPVNQQYVYP